MARVAVWWGAGLLLAAGEMSTASNSSAAPVSYWRFEAASSLGTDSASPGPGQTLTPTSESAWSARPFGSGGIVGGYAEVANATLAAVGG